MIEITEVLKVINGMVKKEFPNFSLYSDEIKEGFKKPSFFITLKPISIVNESVDFRTCKYDVQLVYFQQKRSYIDNLQVADKLQRMFGYGFLIPNSYAIVQSFDFDMIGTESELLEVFVTIEYKENTRVEDTKTPLATEIKLSVQNASIKARF